MVSVYDKNCRVFLLTDDETEVLRYKKMNFRKGNGNRPKPKPKTEAGEESDWSSLLVQRPISEVHVLTLLSHM